MSIEIHIGDCMDVLRAPPYSSVHCCVTSPPYYGLRDYGVDGQIGLEETPAEFIEKLVEVFREVRRVLRPDGTCWVNMGDSYAAAGGGTIKPKDMMGMPWRLAFALQDDGWYLRQDIIWSKPNPMPESVTDRCTKAHEYLFLLSKSSRYYYDAYAIREPLAYKTLTTFGTTRKSNGGGELVKAGNWKEMVRKPKEWKRPDGWDSSVGDGGHGNFHKKGREKGRKSGNKHHKYVDAYEAGPGEEHRTKAGLMKVAQIEWMGSNKRSVWTVATQPFKEAHFATFPPALIEPCILAGCPAGGVVLDPFFGAGTTGLVADRLQRNCIGIELNPRYARIAQDRLRDDAGMFIEQRVAE